MADLTIPAGDFGFKVYFYIEDADGNAFDLTDYTIALKYWQANKLETVQSGACVIEGDAANGKVSYTVIENDFPAMLDYEFEMQLTKEGVRQSTVIQTLRVEQSA